MTRIDPFTAKVSLGLTSHDPLCSDSTKRGRLEAVFLNGSFFGLTDSKLLNLEDGSVAFHRPYCTSLDGSPLAGCQSSSIRGRPKKYFTLGATVQNNVSWSGARNVANLGDFYITGIADLQGTGKQAPLRHLLGQGQDLPPLQIGLRFTDIGYGAGSYSVVSDALFVPRPPLPAPPVVLVPGNVVPPALLRRGSVPTTRLCQHNVAATRQPVDDAEGKTSQVCTSFNVKAIAFETYQVRE